MSGKIQTENLFLRKKPKKFGRKIDKEILKDYVGHVRKFANVKEI